MTTGPGMFYFERKEEANDNGVKAMPMQFTIPPDLEALVQKRLASGAFANAEDVIRHALEAQDAQQSWTEEERRALPAHIEEGFLQAERGEVIDGDQARHEIQAMKDQWLEEHSSG